MNTVLPASHFVNFAGHIGAENVQVGAFNFLFMVELVGREEDIALGVVIQRHGDVRVTFDKIPDGTGFWLRKGRRATIDVGGGVTVFAKTHREIAVQVNAKGTVAIVAAVLAPEREVVA